MSKHSAAAITKPKTLNLETCTENLTFLFSRIKLHVIKETKLSEKIELVMETGRAGQVRKLVRKSVIAD